MFVTGLLTSTCRDARHCGVIVSETELKSFADVRRHSQELAAQRAGDERAPRWGKIAKRITWMVLIAGAFLVYYLFDKLEQALSLLG